MSTFLLHIITAWLQLLAATDEPHEIREVELGRPYLISNRQRIGPVVAKLHRDVLIESADAVRSVRPSRRNSIARR